MDEVQHRNIRPTDVFSPAPMNAAITHNDDQANQTVHVSNTLPQGSGFPTVHLHTMNTVDTVTPIFSLRSESSSPSISPPPAINSSVETRSMGNGDAVRSFNNPWHHGDEHIQGRSLAFNIDVPVCRPLCTPADLGLLYLDAGQQDAPGTDTSAPTAERHHLRATVSLSATCTSQASAADASLLPLPPHSTTAENTYGVLAQHLSQGVSGLSNDNTAMTMGNTTSTGGPHRQQQSIWGLSVAVQQDDQDDHAANYVSGNSDQTSSSSTCTVFDAHDVSRSVSQDHLIRNHIPRAHQPLAPAAAPSQRQQSPTPPTASPRSPPQLPQSMFLNPTAAAFKYPAHPSAEILPTVPNTTITTPSQLFEFLPQHHHDSASHISPYTTIQSTSTAAAAASLTSSTPPTLSVFSAVKCSCTCTCAVNNTTTPTRPSAIPHRISNIIGPFMATPSSFTQEPTPISDSTFTPGIQQILYSDFNAGAETNQGQVQLPINRDSSRDHRGDFHMRINGTDTDPSDSEMSQENEDIAEFVEGKFNGFETGVDLEYPYTHINPRHLGTSAATYINYGSTYINHGSEHSQSNSANSSRQTVRMGDLMSEDATGLPRSSLTSDALPVLDADTSIHSFSTRRWQRRRHASSSTSNSSTNNLSTDASSATSRSPPPPSPPSTPPSPQRTTPDKRPVKRHETSTSKQAKHFACTVPGCTKVFTRRFNLEAHMRCHE
ncbi:hypothetical protein HK102_001362, partial [Quaeritorhiza haematococci]